MPVVLLLEFDNPKDEARNAKRRKFEDEATRPYREKLVEEKGIKAKFSGWADCTGHIVVWWEFETMEDFAKMWNDEKWQQIWARWTYLVDNASIRLLRPSITLPKELFL